MARPARFTSAGPQRVQGVNAQRETGQRIGRLAEVTQQAALTCLRETLAGLQPHGLCLGQVGGQLLMAGFQRGLCRMCDSMPAFRAGQGLGGCGLTRLEVGQVAGGPPVDVGRDLGVTKRGIFSAALGMGRCDGLGGLLGLFQFPLDVGELLADSLGMSRSGAGFRRGSSDSADKVGSAGVCEGIARFLLGDGLVQVAALRGQAVAPCIQRLTAGLVRRVLGEFRLALGALFSFPRPALIGMAQASRTVQADPAGQADQAGQVSRVTESIGSLG